MIFIILIFVFGLYLLISISAIYFSVRWARRSGKSPWLWGGLAAFLMYNLVFWDWIPTVVAHKYYCAKQAGLTVYKTLDEWRNENPGVEKILTKTEDKTFVLNENEYAYKSQKFLNQRLYYLSEMKKNYGILGVRLLSSEIVDTRNNEVLVKRINFDTDIKSFGLGDRGLRDYKIWMDYDSCLSNQEWVKDFDQYLSGIRDLGSNN